MLRQVSYSGSLSAEEKSKSTCKSQSNYRHAGTKDRERKKRILYSKEKGDLLVLFLSILCFVSVCRRSVVNRFFFIVTLYRVSLFLVNWDTLTIPDSLTSES